MHYRSTSRQSVITLVGGADSYISVLATRARPTIVPNGLNRKRPASTICWTIVSRIEATLTSDGLDKFAAICQCGVRVIRASAYEIHLESCKRKSGSTRALPTLVNIDQQPVEYKCVHCAKTYKHNTTRLSHEEACRSESAMGPVLMSRKLDCRDICVPVLWRAALVTTSAASSSVGLRQ